MYVIHLRYCVLFQRAFVFLLKVHQNRRPPIHVVYYYHGRTHSHMYVRIQTILYLTVYIYIYIYIYIQDDALNIVFSLHAFVNSTDIFAMLFDLELSV
jgi:hypothetical protein